MSGTAARGDSDQGACEYRSCRRPFGHRGDHLLRRCDHHGCTARTRNAEERYCVRHESRETYERYEAEAK